MGTYDAYVQIIENENIKTKHIEGGSMNFIDFEFIARKAHEISRLGYRVNTLDYSSKDSAFIYINLYVDTNITGRLIVEYTEEDDFSKKRKISQPRMWLVGLSQDALDLIEEHIKVLGTNDLHIVHRAVTKYLQGATYAAKVENKLLAMFPEEIADFFLWKDVYCRELSKKEAREITKYLISKDKAEVNKPLIKKFLTAVFLNFSM
jgi:hypothetical protein